MAELATVARPYAEALIRANSANLSQAQAWVEELGVVCADETLQEFAAHPKHTPDQVRDVVEKLLKSPLPEQAKNFIALLLENGRISAMPLIAAQFRQLKNAAEGVADAVVQSAFEMTQAQLEDLQPLLEKRFAQKLNLVPEVRPELIGGIRVVVGDEVLDSSIKSKVEQMKVALTA